MHSPFVGVPSFRGSLELNPLVLWIKAKEQVASLVNAGRKMVQDEARGTMCSWYIMCKWYYTKTFSRGANSNPEGCWIDTSLGTSFRFFFGRSGSICTQVYMYTYTVHIMTMIHRSDPCFVCLSISIFKTDWANPSQEVEDPKSFLARGQSCKRKPGEKMCEKLGEWIGIHSQLWIPF